MKICRKETTVLGSIFFVALILQSCSLSKNQEILDSSRREVEVHVNKGIPVPEDQVSQEPMASIHRNQEEVQEEETSSSGKNKSGNLLTEWMGKGSG